MSAVPKKKFIALCTPSLGAVSVYWATAIACLHWPKNYGKLPLVVVDELGGEIAEARNRIVSVALGFDTDEREVTHLMWIDDDVIVPQMALLALYAKQADIASGVYFTKEEFSEPLLYPCRVGGAILFEPNQCFELWGHGMGLCLVKTEVYRKLLEAGLSKDKYGRPEWYKTTTVEDQPQKGNMLDCGGTEDLYFLHRTAELGYKSVIDTGKHAFGWHYDLKNRTGFPPRQWAQYAEAKPVTWDLPGGKTVTWT